VRLGQRSAPAWMSQMDRRSPMSVVSSQLCVVDEVQALPSPVHADPPEKPRNPAPGLARVHTSSLETDKRPS